MKKTVVFIVCCILVGCSSRNPEQGGRDALKKTELLIPDSRSSMVFAIADTFASDHSHEAYEENEGRDGGISKQTRLRFPGYTLVFHDFMGYTPDEGNQYTCQFGSYNGKNGAELNISEQESEGYRETLIATDDTVSLSEILFDDRINNTMIQVLPEDPGNRFELSFCYLSMLGEIIDHRGLSLEEREVRYANSVRFNEQTAYYAIRDSAGFYFRALPHTSDMVEVDVEGGELLPVKSNTPAQIDWERAQWMDEIKRIKAKYGLRDTLVIIPGEYDTVAELTKDKKLFGYGYQSFLFRVARFRGDTLLDTNYIVIAIAYGC